MTDPLVASLCYAGRYVQRKDEWNDSVIVLTGIPNLYTYEMSDLHDLRDLRSQSPDFECNSNVIHVSDAYNLCKCDWFVLFAEDGPRGRSLIFLLYVHYVYS